MSRFTRFALVAVLLGPVTACPMPDESTDVCPMAPAVAMQTTTARRSEPTCPEWGCGTNSPTVGDGFVFDELDSSGAPVGPHHIKISNPTLGGQPVQLNVERHFLSAKDDKGVTYDLRGLIGTTFTLNAVTGSGESSSYELVIADVVYDDSTLPNGVPHNSVLHFWAGVSEPVPYYRIVVLPLPGDNSKPKSICKASSEPLWEAVTDYAIAFSGDHYDASAKTVTSTGEGSSLFNLACAGAAPAKMHLMRHTDAGSYVAAPDRFHPRQDYPTKIAQRQAMLKMFTADYCGTGRSFTVDGQPLSYGDRKHWYLDTPTILSGGVLAPSGSTMEALWNETGAVCLDMPRPALVPMDPIMPVSRREVEGECRCGGHSLPPCTGSGGALSSGSGAEVSDWHVISATVPDAVPPPDAGAL
jgi:hypothetical protein